MRLSLSVILIFALTCCKNQSEIKMIPEGDPLLPVEISDLKIGGEIGRRIDITINNNLFMLDIDNDFLSSFQKKNDAGYIGIGKLIDGVVRMAAYTKDTRVASIKKHLTTEIIKAQENDGYIGNMSKPNRMWNLWDIHEMGYIIYGLTTDYRLFSDKESLSAAEKAAGYIISNWSSIPENWGDNTGVAPHVAVTGIHRTMLTLFEVTENKKYLNFCMNELDLKNLDPGIVIGRRKLIEGHIYAYMAACLAQLELYRIDRDEKLLGPSMKALDFMLNDNGMAISGGAGQEEIWTADQDGRGDLGESCATAYQLRVYDNLLRLKNDSRYGDIMERTIYNALFGAQSPDGRHVRYFTPFEGERHYHNGDTYCCPCNYRRFISELPEMVYYRSENGVAVNLYTTSKASIPLDGKRTVSVSQDTDYPNSGIVLIKIDPSEPVSFTLKLRIPSWCKETSISINSEPSDAECRAGSFTDITRIWSPGDVVSLNMKMEWRLVKGRERQAGRAAVMRGPVIFCLNPDQNESLSGTDAADLGKIVIDRLSIEKVPVNNHSIRPDGMACILKAGNKPFAMGNTGNLTLKLTEFADPDGKCTYFVIPDLSEAEPDELSEIWKNFPE